MRTVLLLLLAALATTPIAWAQDAPPVEPVSADDEAHAKALFEQGKTLYEEGHYAEAIEAWQEGYRLSGRPLFHYNIGNAYERLGDLPHAIDELQKYRAVAPSAEQTTLDRRIESLKERLKAQQPVAPPAPEPAPEPVPVPVPAPSPPERAPMAATWALGGVAVAGAGVGVGFGLAANAAKRTANDQCVVSTDRYCWVAADPYLKRNTRDAAVADVGFGVAGAAAIAGVLVTFLDARGPRVRPTLLRGGGGLVLGGSW